MKYFDTVDKKLAEELHQAKEDGKYLDSLGETKMREINKIIIDCSDSEWGDARIIDQWHKLKGWNGIGYHNVILNGRLLAGKYRPNDDGAVESGRSIEEVGAHVKGHNDDSIGICLIGRATFTPSQIGQLLRLCRHYMKEYKIPIFNVLGHCELDKFKTSPNINMVAFRKLLEVVE